MTRYVIDCPDELWEDFKETFPNSMTINDRLVQLIENEVQG